MSSCYNAENSEGVLFSVFKLIVFRKLHIRDVRKRQGCSVQPNP